MLHFIKPKQKPPIQIFDLLQLSRKERECRDHYLRTKRRLEDWEKMCGIAANGRLLSYLKIEGTLLRRQVQDAILFYRIVRGDRLRAFKHYMEKLPVRAAVYGVAS